MTTKNKISSMAYELGSSYWAISQKGFDAIVSILAGGEPEAVAKDGESSFVLLSDPASIDGTWYAKREGSIGVLEVHGPIIPYRTWYEGFAGLVSVESLKSDLDVLARDKSVERVVVTYDTPGGIVDAVSGFAATLRDFPKPLDSHIVGDAASAGYWLASQGGKVTSVDTGRAGSIGVVSTIVDFKEAYEKKGVKVFDVVSSQSPRKRTDLTTQEGRSELQGILDGIADVFIDAVADGRNVPREKVLSGFGQGGMFVAADAVERGLVDKVMSTSELFSSFEQNNKSNFFIALNESDEMEGKDMKESKKEKEEMTAVDSEAIAKAERERIQSVEKIAGTYQDDHPSVVEAVADKINEIKYNAGLSLSDAKVKIMEAATVQMRALVANEKESGALIAEAVASFPDTGSKEASLASSSQERPVDENRVKGIVRGIKGYKR